MIAALQVFGIIYILFMLYLTFLYYKRNNYSVQSFVFWVAVWAIGAILLAIPETLNSVIQQFTVARVIDFYLIVGLMFFSAVCFFSFAAVKRTENKVEDLVRQLALKRRK